MVASLFIGMSASAQTSEDTLTILMHQLEDIEVSAMRVQQTTLSTATVKNEVILAMSSLGYSSSDALKVLSTIDISPDMRTEDLLREALRKMNI